VSEPTVAAESESDSEGERECASGRGFAAWPSPIAAADVAAAHGSISWVGQVRGSLWWVESDPADGGRLALWRLDDDQAVRLTPDGMNVRNRVHEYGGLPWAASDDGFVVTDWEDQRLYAGGAAGIRPLTPAPAFDAQYRYAEPVVVGREVWVLREEFFSESPTDLVRSFVAVPLDGSAAADPGAVRVLGGDHRFLSCLRVSPTGEHVSWIGWDHPHMSWDQSELVVADVRDGRFVNRSVVSGGPGDAICQAEWDFDGGLVFLSDRSGWWNLYRLDHPGAAPHGLLPIDHELGGALWKPGTSWLAVLGEERYGVLDHGEPAILDARAGTLTPIEPPAGSGVTTWSAFLSAQDGRLASAGYGSHSLPRLVTWDADHGARVQGTHDSLPRLGDDTIDAAWLPTPEFRWIDDGAGAHIPTTLYPPTNPLVGAKPGELPPYIVHIHGGPTGANGVSLDLEIAYFTSRGIGVAAPEYGGSTGFGRAWRERLAGQWGVVDLADAAAVANALVAAGLADPERLVIRGGSAGGFTSAAAMTAPSPFAVGLVSYPVIDLLAWMGGENHDLESQYLVSLVGPLPGAEASYRRRSPAERPERAHGPMLILQGLDDRICRPETTQRFVDGLEAAGKTFEYVGYEGEQHGFRQASTVADAIAREFAFLCRHLRSDRIDPKDRA
jgi:dipeptidyl aminopeptidase/acylaminoacyl peptidase